MERYNKDGRVFRKATRYGCGEKAVVGDYGH
jgi:hypothetical protein